MSPVVWPHRTSSLAGKIPPLEPVMMNAKDFQVNTPARPQAPTKNAANQRANSAQEKRTYHIVMAGGGTGGHLYPGLAVAEALQELLGDRITLTWAATPRPVDQRLLSGFGDRYVQQTVQPLVKKISKMWGFWQGWRQSTRYWKHQFAQHKPDAVLALGGYAAGPAAYVAGKFGVPMALLNPDALPGLANRFLLKRADRIFSQWELPAEMTTGLKGQVRPIGCPIRTSLLGRTRESGAQRLGIDPERPVLVVTGASLGAKTINDAMLELLKDEEIRTALIEGAWQIVHLAGLEQAAAVKAAYEPILDVAWKVMDYCDDMASVWAVADFAIARAGASTCAELTACGVPSMLLPYPFHRDLHQRANAMQLVNAGAAVLVDDEKDAAKNAAAMKQPLLALLYDGTQRLEMADKSQVAGKPHAARDIAAELVALASDQS